MTVTGGEPLLQPEFVGDLFAAAHAAPAGRIHPCLDSCGYAYNPKKPERFEKLLSETDMVLLDIKHSDPVRHKAPVSYTHLDVYKRQDLCGQGEGEGDLHHLGEARLTLVGREGLSGCLLYTSRCV